MKRCLVLIALALSSLASVAAAGAQMPGSWLDPRVMAQPLPPRPPEPRPQPQPAPQPVPVVIDNPAPPVVVNAAAEPPSFLVQMISMGLTALFAALGLGAAVPAIPLISRFAARALFDVQGRLKERVKGTVGDALIARAAELPKTDTGMVPADHKQDLLGFALQFAKEHELGPLKYLGLKPDSPALMRFITTQAETLLADPKFPVSIAQGVGAGVSTDRLAKLEQGFARLMQRLDGGGAKNPG